MDMETSEVQVVSSRQLLSFTGAFLIIAIAHLALFSTTNLITILNLIRSSFQSILGGRTPGAISYYGSFYALTPLQQILVFAVRLGRDAISVLLVILAPLAIFLIKIKDKRFSSLYYVIAIPTVLSFAAFVFSLFIRSYIVNRGLIYMSIFVPFFAGITIYWLVYSRHFRFQKLVFGIVLLSLFCISVLQLYPAQPLVPKILTDSGSYYVMDLRAFTTVYDSSVISFLSSRDLQTTLATDSTFRSQIYALTNVSFQALMTTDNPGSGPIKAGLILVSFDGNTHILVSGRDAVQYAQYVDSALQNYTVVYSNSKSFVLLNSPNP